MPFFMGYDKIDAPSLHPFQYPSFSVRSLSLKDIWTLQDDALVYFGWAAASSAVKSWPDMNSSLFVHQYGQLAWRQQMWKQRKGQRN